MKMIKAILLITIIFVPIGCKKGDERIYVRDEIKSDSLVSNIVTRPVAHAFSALIGEGIEVESAVLKRNEADLLELYVNGYNRSYSVRKFRYRVEWVDKDGLVIGTKTSVWLPVSAMKKSPFSFKVAATSPQAVDFRMDTRKWE